MEILIGIALVFALSWLLLRNASPCPDCGIWTMCCKCEEAMSKEHLDIEGRQ